MNYEQPKYKARGEAIINELFPELMNVKIAWLASDKKKMDAGRIVHADCRKVSAQYDWCCDYDFIITVYEPNVANFDDEQLNILLEHELMHIGASDGNFSIVPHDAEEFIAIIKKYGIDWSEPKCK